jgi:cytochrome b6-f complex iron-sulfur subunit
MHRKDFIKGSCGVCLALSSGFLTSALLSACKTPLGVIKSAASNDIVSIPLAAFDKSDYKIIRVSNYDYDLAIQKNKDGTFSTLLLKCTHAGQPLTKTGSNYYCTLHGSQFTHEGIVTKGPAYENLTQLVTNVAGDLVKIQLIPVS